MRPDFWAGKKVFLTGHTGFKGCWLSLWLQMVGAKLTGFALPPNTEPNLWTVAAVSDRMTSISGDVRDLAHLQAAVSESQPAIIFHMAAQALVRESYANPVDTYATNVMGTVNLLEAARLTDSVQAIVVVTTDKCYENNEWVWGYRENDPLGGFDPYSSSKACAELITATYRNSFFESKASAGNNANRRIAVATARAGNVIGGGDWAEERLVPDIIRSIIADQPVILRNPLATRPWQHVLDPLAGYLGLAEALFQDGDRFASSWNFGPNDNAVHSVAWITEQLLELWGGQDGWIQDPNHNPHEARSLKLDSSKAQAQLDWSPTLESHDALAWIVEWVESWQNHANMHQVTLDQITRYMELLSTKQEMK